MGAIGGLMGLGSGAAGTAFAGPTSATIQNTVSPAQLAAANAQTQTGIQGQQALLTALQGQNGLGNQANVFNQLKGVAAGTGPNPAQAMLNQQTGQNIAAQGALMAGQRGAGSNVGLMARQAAQQGANTQQQAVGQGASLQAQQSLGALGQMGNMANTQAGQQIAQTNAVQQAQANQQANLLSAMGALNNTNVGMQSNINNVNGQLANTQLQGQQAMIGGLMNSMGSAGNMMGGSGGGGGGGMGSMAGLAALAARGGEVSGMAEGGYTPVVSGAAPTGDTPAFASDPAAAALQKGMSSMLSGGQSSGQPAAQSGASNTGSADTAPGSTDLPTQNTPASFSDFLNSGSGGSYVAARGGQVDFRSGGHVPGQPKVGGTKNSYSNDTVPAMLSPGEIVLPRSVTKSSDPATAAAKFVSALRSKKGSK
jgi:hypothetical protein